MSIKQKKHVGGQRDSKRYEKRDNEIKKKKTDFFQRQNFLKFF